MKSSTANQNEKPPTNLRKLNRPKPEALPFLKELVKWVSVDMVAPNLHYIIGDATVPTVEGNKIIAHVCNDIGAWGNGFVLAISERWPQPKIAYLNDKFRHSLKLGFIRLVQVEPAIWVANMVAQRDIRVQNGVPPIRYDALKQCLEKLATEAKILNASVHMPRIGCGLAGGNWESVEPLIRATLPATKVFVYDLPQ